MYNLPYVTEEADACCWKDLLLMIKVADNDYYVDNKRIMSQKIKLQSFLEDKEAKVLWSTKELEIKQVEFKLGEDCWDI